MEEKKQRGVLIIVAALVAVFCLGSACLLGACGVASSFDRVVQLITVGTAERPTPSASKYTNRVSL